MGGFFDPQAPLWRGVGRFADVLALSVAWLFLSLPVVTAGAATAALYDSAAKCVLGGQNGALSRFWDTFRRELKGSIPALLVWGGACALLIRLIWAIRARIEFQGAPAAVLLAAWYAVLLVPVGALCWMFPLLSRFTFSWKGLIATSLRLALGYLPRTFLIVLCAVGGVILSLWLLVPMLVLPCLVAMAWVKAMEGVFLRYTPPEGGESPPNHS